MMEYDWLKCDIKDLINAGCNKKIKRINEKDVNSDVIPINVVIKNIQNTKRKFNVNLKFEFNQKDPLIEWKIIFTTSPFFDLIILS